MDLQGMQFNLFRVISDIVFYGGNNLSDLRITQFILFFAG